MDQPDAEPAKNDEATPCSTVVPPIGVSHPDQEQDADTRDAAPLKGQNKKWDAAKAYFGQLINEKPDRHIELLLTLVIAFFAAVQLITSCNNNAETGQQTNQLISAAKISAYAADQNAQAARSFSDSARKINEGIGDAVSELNRQAKISELSRETADNTATRAMQSTNENFHREQRAWVGVVGVTDIQIVANRPLGGRVVFLNSGKTPALRVKTDTVMKPIPSISKTPTFDYPTRDPRNPYDIASEAVIQPGATYRNDFFQNTLLDEPTYMRLQYGLDVMLIYGKIDYFDVFGGERHTKFCFVVDRSLKAVSNCDESFNYNDAT